MTKDYGKDIGEILSLFMEDVCKADLLVAHNLDFGVNIIASEMFRIGRNPGQLLSTNSHCTMKSNVNLVKLQTSRGYKFPKLSELYKFCFHEDMKLGHHALADTENTIRCYYFVRDDIVDLVSD